MVLFMSTHPTFHGGFVAQLENNTFTEEVNQVPREAAEGER